MRDIVFFGVSEWTAMPQRSHHLARGLSQTNRVLYVNPCYYSAAGFARDALQRRSPRKSVFSLREVENQLYIADLPPLLPRGLHHPHVAHLNYRLLTPLIRHLMTKLRFDQVILWLSLPPDRVLLQQIKARLSVFDYMDNYSEFFSGKAQQRLQREEMQLLQAVDMVLASSMGLSRRARVHNPNTHLVYNGVAEQFLAPLAQPTRLELPPRPIIGYVGTLGTWIDQPLLKRLALELPAWSVVLIGPEAADFSDLKGIANLHFMGEHPYSEIPSIISQFDVAMIPFLVNDLTTDINPIKLFEYMALGKPIVSTLLPEVRHYGSIVSIADNHDEFVRLVTLAQNEDRTLQSTREFIASQNTWQDRVRQIEQLF